MKSLIRFEDTYGLTDIFCATHGYEYLDNTRIAERMIEITPDIFIDFGLASGWGHITNVEAYTIMERGIDRIIVVYDMDNLQGIKNKLLEQSDLENRIKGLKNIFKNISYNIEIGFMPVVYAAETIMLYQFIEQDTMRIQKLVNSINTNYMQLCILAYLLKYKDVKRAKRVRDYIHLEKLIGALAKKERNDLNRNLKDWIIGNCSVENDSIFNSIEALEHLTKTQTLFDKYILNTDKFIELDQHKIYMNKTPIPLL